MIAYILKSAGCMLLLLAVYYLFLEREKMHRFNRYFLVFGLIFSLSVPFITFTITAEIPLSNQVSEINQRLAGQPSAPPAYTPPKNPAPTVNTPTDSSISYRVILWRFYLLVAAILLIRLLGNLYRLYSKINQNPWVSYQSATLILVEGCSVPHSFFSYIFVDKGLYESGRVDQSIFTHELTHAHQKHSIDTSFIEILKVVFWFNPVLYFYKKAMQMNHEFLADESVIAASNDVSAYQKLLLKINSGDAPHTLASSIHFSITKKRFIMMTKKSTRLRTVSKQLALIPVLAGLIFAFSTRTITAQDVSSMSITELMEAVEAKMYSVDELSDNEKEDLNRLVTKIQRELNVKVPPPPPPLSVSLSPEEALQALTDSYSEQTSYYSSIKPMERNRDKLEASYEKVLILYKEVDKLEKKIDPKNPPPPPPKPLSPDKRINTGSEEPPAPPKPVKKDTTNLDQIREKYVALIGQYLDIKPVRENVDQMEKIHSEFITIYDNWSNQYEDKNIKKLPPPPPSPEGRINSYYNTHYKTVPKDLEVLNRLTKSYEKRLEEYSKISPISDGNLKYVYKRATVIYNNWYKIFEETEGLKKLTPLPTSPEERIAAYKKD